MIKIRLLTTEEQEILEKHYKHSPCCLIRERAHTLLLANQKRTVKDIVAILIKNENTICQWLNDFNKKGISSIFHQYNNNINASKLTREQKKEINQILKSPPSECGLPKQFWDVPTLKKYLNTEFGIVYESERSYHYLLKFNGFSFKLPMPFDFKRNVEQINLKLKEIHQKIPEFLNNDKWEIFAADEARITWEAEIRRAWIKRGEKIIIKVHRSDDYQNYFGVLNLKTKKAHVIALDWQNTDEIIKALDNLSNRKEYKGKNICLQWDNSKWHKSKKLREMLEKNNILSHIYLISFPPYAPDINPQEHVWNFGKTKLGNHDLCSFEETRSVFEKSIEGKRFDYKIPEFVLR